MRTPRGLVVALLLCVTALTALAVALERRARRPAKISAELDVAEALGGGLGGDEADARFTRATLPREFVFPADHGAHDGFRTEWWYVTGNLFAADGRAFGVQLTFFRNALAAEISATAPSSSHWRSAHVWMAHFALSDEQGDTFRFAERFAREAVGLAGVTTAPFRVALEDWSIASSSPSGSDFSPLRLAARDGGFAVEGYGTDPDIEVEIRPEDHAKGLDPQLERGIVEAMKLVETLKPRVPEPGPRPDRRPPPLPKA